MRARLLWCGWMSVTCAACADVDRLREEFCQARPDVCGVDGGAVDAGRDSGEGGDGGLLDAGSSDGGIDAGPGDAGYDAGNGPRCVASGATAVQVYGVVDQPYDVVLVDMDVDGTLDLVTLNSLDNTWSIALNNGSGQFGAASVMDAGSLPRRLIDGDFDTDGITDLAWLDGTRLDFAFVKPGSVQRRSFPTGLTSPTWLAPGDFFGFGRTDVAVADLTTNRIRMMSPNFSDGGFVQSGDVSPNIEPDRIRGGHWSTASNGTDLGVSDLTHGSVNLIVNQGGGMFNVGTPVGLPGADDMTFGDFNGDGNLDLVLTGGAPGPLVLFLGDGNGHLTRGTDPAASPSYAVPFAGDLNGDGKVDLVFLDNQALDVVVALGEGDGGFGPPTSIAHVGGGPSAIALGDLDGNGDIDVVVSNSTGRSVTVVLNPCAQAPDGGGQACIPSFQRCSFVTPCCSLVQCQLGVCP